MRNEAVKEHRALAHGEETTSGKGKTTCPNDDGMYDSDPSWSECADSESDNGSSDGWYDSDASVEGGLLNVDTTFLKRYQSEYWLRDEDDTVGYRIRCLGEDLELWLGRWGGVDNWSDIAANPARQLQIREQMELGIQYAKLMQQVWGARAQDGTVESREVKVYWERTAKMMSKLYDALSMLGVHMDWDSEYE
jgi:hypothetical protein